MSNYAKLYAPKGFPTKDKRHWLVSGDKSLASKLKRLLFLRGIEVRALTQKEFRDAMTAAGLPKLPAPIFVDADYVKLLRHAFTEEQIASIVSRK